MKAIFAVAILPLDGEGCAVVAEGDREEGLLALPDLFPEAPLREAALPQSVRFARLAAAAGAQVRPASDTPPTRRFATGPILALAGDATARGEDHE